MSLPDVHRVVTGHDESGTAIVSSQGQLPVVQELDALPGLIFHEIWNTSGAPAPIDNAGDPTLGGITLSPPSLGTRIRILDFPPESGGGDADHGQAQEAFAAIGGTGASTADAGSPHAYMHRTETVDYGIVLQGEITLILDDSEVDMRAGSIVIQRGTNHAWSNRSDAYCRMAFILIDGGFDPQVKNALEQHKGA